MQDFVALDFETANRQRASACEIALVRFKDGEPHEVFSTLLRPPDEVNYFENTWIHGITEQDCQNAPMFPDLLDQLIAFVGTNPIVCHNSGFDLSVLRQTLDAFGCPYPTVTYGCTLAFSRKAFREDPGIVSFTLGRICGHLGIPFSESHRAEADASACGMVAAKLLTRAECSTLETAAQRLGVVLGNLGPDVDERCHARGSKRQLPEGWDEAVVQAHAKSLGVTKLDPGGEFLGKSVVLTGELQSMTRREAEVLLEAVGATIKTSVSKKTDILIEGKQDPRKVGEDGVSTKHKKCMQLKAGGHDIEVLDEQMFLDNLCD